MAGHNIALHLLLPGCSRHVTVPQLRQILSEGTPYYRIHLEFAHTDEVLACAGLGGVRAVQSEADVAWNEALTKARNLPRLCLLPLLRLISRLGAGLINASRSPTTRSTGKVIVPFTPLKKPHFRYLAKVNKTFQV